MKTEEQRLLDELYNRDERVSNKLPQVDPNKVAKLQEGLEINGQKIPDPKSHQIISFIKSGVRILGYVFLPIDLVTSAIILILSEVLGIYEELV